MVAASVFVAVSFDVRSPYNAEPEIVDSFLRNRILFWITHTSLQWVFALLVALAAFSFAIFPFTNGAARLKAPLYLVGLGGLLPFEVIEQRYYLPLFALFWAVRAPAPKPVERLQLLLNISLTVAAFRMFVSSEVFL